MAISDSPNYKLQHAEAHVATLDNEIRAWSESQPYQLIRYRNSDATRHGLRVKIEKTPPLLRWSLLAGDCVHNTRAALDHLVYAVAVQESQQNPPPAERNLEFPLTDSPDAVDKRKWRIKTLRAGVQAEIETLQPYKRPQPATPPLLGVLRELDDMDKHRLITMAIAQQVHGAVTNVKNMNPGDIARFEGHVGAVVDGTEVVTMMFERPTPSLQFAYEGSLIIAIAHAPGPTGEKRAPAIELLRALIAEARVVVDRIAALAP